MTADFRFFLQKLKVKLDPTGNVEYALSVAEKEAVLELNALLGKKITLQFTHRLQCIACHTFVKKIYQQGYCFPCTQTKASCDLCIVKPERCHFHLGSCREPAWGEEHCFSPHIIYLANTSGLKVGITRATQVPTRWIDQGAILALPIFQVTSRYHAGLIEVALAKQLKDKTDWRKMLKQEIEKIDLILKRDSLNLRELLVEEIKEPIRSQIHPEYLSNAIPTPILYPILEIPAKIVSLNLEKIEQVSGILLGIKGQYLIFDTGVLNVRNHTGFEVEMSLS